MKSYAGKRVLVTGGLGFIGSNLCIRLVQLGADVTIVDSMEEGCGGNLRNIDSISGKVKVFEADIGDSARIPVFLKRVDTVFNLAGEISHTHSMEFPERDLTLNTRSQLNFLRECGKRSPGLRVVYAGTRQVYGRPSSLPVDESHSISPVDFNGIHKHAAEQYHLILSRDGVLDAVVLRLTNVYGPRLGLNVTCQGVLSTFFLNLAIGRPVEVFGDGTQLRDPLYVDDAIDALLRAGAEKCLRARIYNVGGGQSLNLSEIATILCRLAGASPPRFRPFPRDRSVIDIGSFMTDSTLIRQHLGWVPATAFEDGAASTVRFFRSRLRDYLDPMNPYPGCNLHQNHFMTRTAASE